RLIESDAPVITDQSHQRGGLCVMCARPSLSSAVFLSVCLALIASPATAHTADAVPTSGETGGQVGFTVFGRALFPIKREGQFTDFAGQLSYDPAHPADTQV